jgi:hypothetical protein
LTAATTTQVKLCVGVVSAQSTRELGQAAAWTVAAWTTGGNLPDVKIQLRATPTSAGTPRFTFGCGSDDGTSACDLGAVDASAAKRQLQAQVSVPLTAATLTSVSLTATGSAANLSKDPAASAGIGIIAPASPVGASTTLTSGTLPGLTDPTLSPTLSPGGNASGLFPTLDPQSSDPSSAEAARTAGTAGTAQVANTSAISGGSSTLGAQVAGLVALALAGVFAVTRISIRRPAASGAAATSTGAPPAKAETEAAGDAAAAGTAGAAANSADAGTAESAADSADSADAGAAEDADGPEEPTADPEA